MAVGSLLQLVSASRKLTGGYHASSAASRLAVRQIVRRVENLLQEARVRNPGLTPRPQLGILTGNRFFGHLVRTGNRTDGNLRKEPSADETPRVRTAIDVRT